VVIAATAGRQEMGGLRRSSAPARELGRGKGGCPNRSTEQEGNG
jgi:hypothetical protein